MNKQNGISEPARVPLAPLAAAQPQATRSLFSRSNKNLSAIKPFHGLTRKRQPGLNSRGIQEAFLILIGFLIGLFMGCASSDAWHSYLAGVNSLITWRKPEVAGKPWFCSPEMPPFKAVPQVRKDAQLCWPGSRSLLGAPSGSLVI